MLVCMPSQRCRWWPVQPAELKSSLCVCMLMCVCKACLWECLFVVGTSPRGSDLFTKLRVKLRDSFIYKCYIIINFSVFAGSRFEKESQAIDWIHILTLENPQNLFLSVCQQAHPNSDGERHNVPSISSTETMIRACAEAACVNWKRGCIILSKVNC